MREQKVTIAACILLCCCATVAAVAVQAQLSPRGIPEPLRTPASVTTSLSLPGGYGIDVTVDFESATNASLVSVGIAGLLVSPIDGTLLARLPTGVTIPEELPVMVLIEPPPLPLNPLEFDGIANITLLTSNLPYFPGTRLRLFSAHDGGDFADITEEISHGSYRVRGSQGDFSEFMIVHDDRTNHEIVNDKLAALQARLATHVGDIDGAVYAALDVALDDAAAAIAKANRAAAIVALDSFTAALNAATPAEVPDHWQTVGGDDNVAGVLRALAGTLRFSLATTHTRGVFKRGPRTRAN